MTISDFARIVIHIPIGMLIGIPIIGAPLRETFHMYEANEDKHIQDQAWKDLRGAMVGEIIDEIIFLALIVGLLLSYLRVIP